MTIWLILHYKLPSKPSALRVYVWRKLKRLGAILLNEAVWILPDTPRTAEQFQWLVAEIQEMKGEVALWRSNLILGQSEDALVEKFRQQVDSEYETLLKQLDRKQPDLSKISQEYQQVMTRDHFRSEMGRQIKERLLTLRGKTQ
jgi:DNA-binding transcriptional regulator PaaX